MILLDVILVGLLIGSFLNVVIYRLPLVMEWEWRHSSRDCLHLPDDPKDPKPSSFHQGRSFCPHCHHQLSALENIPLLSFVFLRGKCAHCKAPISWRYPTVEAGTALLFYLSYAFFGLSSGGALFLLAAVCWWTLLWIDAQTYLLPDPLVYLSLWAGLLASALGVSPLVDTVHAIVGALIGWGALWSVAWLYRLIRNREGMGGGDFKLLAALGAWVGPWGLLPIVLVSTLLGTLWAIIGMIRGQDKTHPIPFGPFLILAGLLVWFFPELWKPYLMF